MSDNSAMEEYSEYVERFYEPDVTAYDFLCLLSALYASKGEFSFDRDRLISFISHCKNNSMFARLLSDINLKSNGISCYSCEFDEAIMKLRLGGILYTVSPERDSSICIALDTPASELIEERVAYRDEVTCFIDEFKEFEKSNQAVHNRTLGLAKNNEQK